MALLLIIEDDQIIRKQIADFLKLENFDVLEAENGTKGVEKAFQSKPDLIVCDIMMPGMDGFEVLKLIRENPKTSTTPFIFLTARAELENLREGMNLGADDYLVKPIKFDDLLKSISTRLKKHSLLQEKFQNKIENMQNHIAISFPHEFRTPLNTILGYSQLLIDAAREEQNSEMELIGQSIFSAGKRLLRLVSNFNEYIKLSHLTPEEKTIITRSKITYHQGLKDTCTSIAEKYDKKQDLIFNLTEDAYIKFNETYFKKVCEEIMDNACKFSFPKTPIKVESTIIGNKLILSFINYGITLSQDQIDMVDAFVQFDRGKYEQQGIGLGLALTKTILNLFESKLELESVLNGPTVAKIYIPIAT